MGRQSIGAFLVMLGLMFGAVSCRTTPPGPNETSAFASPEAAVQQISQLLRDEDWPSLARYYDLEGSDLQREELTSGAFFINEASDQLPPPGNELSRYHHPFHPAFKFDHVTPADEPGVVSVIVRLEIDQGAGEPARIALDRFEMKRSSTGWRILPPSGSH